MFKGGMQDAIQIKLCDCDRLEIGFSAGLPVNQVCYQCSVEYCDAPFNVLSTLSSDPCIPSWSWPSTVFHSYFCVRTKQAFQKKKKKTCVGDERRKKNHRALPNYSAVCGYSFLPSIALAALKSVLLISMVRVKIAHLALKDLGDVCISRIYLVLFDCNHIHGFTFLKAWKSRRCNELIAIPELLYRISS